jgi:hypothetical protein
MGNGKCTLKGNVGDKSGSEEERDHNESGRHKDKKKKQNARFHIGRAS